MRTCRSWTLAAAASTLALMGCGPRLIGFAEEQSANESESESDGTTDTSDGTTDTSDGTTDTSDGTTDTSDGTTDTSDETTDTSESGPGDDAPSLCDCVDLDPICTPDAAIAMHECALPSPCGVVDGDAEAAECVLELLIAGEPARFEYNISSGQDCSTGYNGWKGWFYILGPAEGIDNECHVDECNNGFGEPPSTHPSAQYYTIADPSDFADCLGKSASVMTGCIFNGLSVGGPVAECGG